MNKNWWWKWQSFYSKSADSEILWNSVQNKLPPGLEDKFKQLMADPSLSSFFQALEKALIMAISLRLLTHLKFLQKNVLCCLQNSISEPLCIIFYYLVIWLHVSSLSNIKTWLLLQRYIIFMDIIQLKVHETQKRCSWVFYYVVGTKYLMSPYKMYLATKACISKCTHFYHTYILFAIYLGKKTEMHFTQT